MSDQMEQLLLERVAEIEQHLARFVAEVEEHLARFDEECDKLEALITTKLDSDAEREHWNIVYPTD